MKHIFALALALLGTAPLRAAEAPTHEVCVIVGAAGDNEFAPGFQKAAQTWQDNCKKAGATCTVIGLDDQKGADPEKNSLDRDKLHDWIGKLAPDAKAPVWIIYLGHGTFDGKDSRFNLRGEDVSAAELAAWLKPVTRPLVFIDGSSASSPFINALSGKNRVIVTATQSGREVDYARFGEKFAEAIADPAADIDQDGEVSVLEAFIMAEQRVQDFYADANRMATEHALLDDNGDKRGTPPGFFQGTRLVRRAQSNATPDGDFARNLALIISPEEAALTPAELKLRAQCEQELETLRAQKDEMAEDDYYAAVEKILRRLEAIYVKPAATAAPPSATASRSAPAATSPPAQ
ncbi:MAG TPA: hypothetical protein VHC95_11485 [Opitutales bacterium]|nr:hypothetical protein [Opitutales bacterium]